jgi:hypothetical protein
VFRGTLIGFFRDTPVREDLQACIERRVKWQTYTPTERNFYKGIITRKSQGRVCRNIGVNGGGGKGGKCRPNIFFLLKSSSFSQECVHLG